MSEGERKKIYNKINQEKGKTSIEREREREKETSFASLSLENDITNLIYDNSK